MARTKSTQKLRVITLTQETLDTVERVLGTVVDDGNNISGEERVQLLRAMGAMSKSLLIEVKYKP